MDRFGFGIVSYFGLLKTFLSFFLILGLAQVPVILRYRQYQTSPFRAPGQLFENMLLGNIGQSHLRCQTFRNDRADIVFGCNAGVLSEFISVGVYQSLSPAGENNLCNHNYFG